MLEHLGFNSQQEQQNYPPEHPDQLQCPPSLQIRIFSGSKVASADSLTTSNIALKRAMSFQISREISTYGKLQSIS
jgi:hypothetical protein